MIPKINSTQGLNKWAKLHIKLFDSFVLEKLGPCLTIPSFIINQCAVNCDEHPNSKHPKNPQLLEVESGHSYLY